MAETNGSHEHGRGYGSKHAVLKGIGLSLIVVGSHDVCALFLKKVSELYQTSRYQSEHSGSTSLHTYVRENQHAGWIDDITP